MKILYRIHNFSNSSLWSAEMCKWHCIKHLAERSAWPLIMDGLGCNMRRNEDSRIIKFKIFPKSTAHYYS